jgi:putative ABC transport system permease protein
MAWIFPVFFLAVGGFIVASMLGRHVDAQRALIGTFAALGVERSRILSHYLAHAVTLGGLGAALGAGGGVLAAPGLTRAYAAELGIPFVVTTAHVDLVATGLVMGVAVSVLAGFLPAWHASRLAPAEAMRPPRPTMGPLARIARRMRAPLAVRMALRDVLGRPYRSLGTALGVAAAFVLVHSTGAMLDSMRTTFSVLFEDARRYDLRVDLLAPAPIPELEARFAHADGVLGFEAVLAAPVTLSAAGREAHALANGMAPGASLLRSMDLDGREVTPASGRVALTRALARSLGVGLGDVVAVRALPGGPTTSFIVGGFADAALGNTVAARREDLERALGWSAKANAVLLRTAEGRKQALRRALCDSSDVGHIEDAGALRQQMDALMGLGWALFATMFASSVVLAAAILFNTATLGILERRRELATLRALGRTLREIGVSLTLEHGLLAFLGVGMGLPIALVATRSILATFSSELFALPFVLAPRTVGFSAFGTAAVLLAAQWPAFRRFARTPLAEVVRVREN